MEQYDQPQVKFNAGIDVALTVSNIIKRCEVYARMQRFDLWYDELQILQRRLMSKALKNKLILQEIKDAEKGKFKDDNSIDSKSLEIWKRKVTLEKPINHKLFQNTYQYLSNYEIVLRKYVDQFGFGNPDAEDDEGL